MKGVHISIEGFDGVGKSTVCEEVSKRLGYDFIEKPLHYLFDEQGEMSNYIDIRDKVNKDPNRVFTSWFYGLGNIYLNTRFGSSNIITDRHIVSNYAWSGLEENKDIFELVLKKIGTPNITIILYSKPEVIKKRMMIRDENDTDLVKISRSEEIYEKMIGFCEEFKLDFVLIDTTNLGINEVVKSVLKELKLHGIDDR